MNRRENLDMVLAVCAFLAALAGPAGAVTHYVSPGESIQAAIDDANDGDEIEVAPGTYYEAINFNGKGIRLYSRDGPNDTTIDGTGHDHVVQCVSGEDANTILEGFTITGGNANGPDANDYYGGGMYNVSGSPTVTNCTFSGNTASYGGGMSNNYYSSPTVSDCTLRNNTADVGGGMANYTESSPTLTNCTFRDNSARVAGGMNNHVACSPTLTNCVFGGNIADEDTGGMNNHSDCNAILNNCVFIGNWAGNSIGGMQNAYSSPTLTNCTFANNNAENFYGAMHNRGNAGNPSRAVVVNCIFWNDTPDEISNDEFSSTTVTVSYSDVEGGWGDPNDPNNTNINADPCFVSAVGGNLRLLSSASACVDAGDNNAPNLAATDLAGNPRVVDGDGNGTATVDMGAYELSQVRNVTRNLYYSTIQGAIDDANDSDEIEVAPGTYNEAINFNGKAVALYSSSGPEVTTIDGSGHYHVVQCVNGEGANTILEGFTITGGDANGPPDPNGPIGKDRCGGGMYNYQSSPTIMNCIFTGNAAFDGGGMYNFYLSSPTVTDCIFSSNGSESGGGMYNYLFSSPAVNNCNFSGNTADWYGGGMHNKYHGDATVTNCTFSSNTAWVGGGMYNSEYSNPALTQCTFNSNTVVQGGGGMCNSDSSPAVTNCTFSGNTTTNQDGGGMLNDHSGPTVTNCLFFNNSASEGAAMYNSLSNPMVTNCTFSGNTAAEHGGGMGNYSSSLTVTNCILWGDVGGEISKVWSSVSVSYSDVQGGFVGTENIDDDPRFVDPDASDLRLRFDSPCVDKGDKLSLPADIDDLDGDGDRMEAIPYDLELNPRVLNLQVDMGAYERAPTTYVPDEFDTIQAAIDAALSGHSVCVRPGTYQEAIDFNGKAIRVYSSDGPEVTTIDANGIGGAYHVVQCVSGEDANTILEGFTITGGNANGNGADANGGGMYNYWSRPTVTDCIFSGNSSTEYGGGMYNYYYSYPTVSNCTFSGNSASDGGGMYNNHNGSPTVTNCTFSGNSATDYGGGMYTYLDSWPTVSNCTFSSNHAEWGGGMYNEQSSTAVTNCTFSGNSASDGGGMYNWQIAHLSVVDNCTFSGNSASYHGGGGMYNEDSGTAIWVSNCTFRSNTAIGYFLPSGGGMYNENSSPWVFNCIFSGNSANDEGGGMYNVGSSPDLDNCTFSGNAAGTHGGGVFNYSSSPSVNNCILWGDTGDEIYDDASFTTVNYSDVQGASVYPGTGNINADACFVYPGYWADANDPNIVVEPNDPNAVWMEGNYRLSPGSPCIDEGDDLALPPDVITDLDGRDRYADGDCNDSNVVDMGAYEFAWVYIGDFDGQCDVDFSDWALFSMGWLTEQGQAGYISDYDISIPADNKVDWADVKIFCDNWLAGK